MELWPPALRGMMSEPLSLKLASVVIVEGPELSGADLAARFRAFGAVVHVVTTTAAAKLLLCRERIDVVIIGYQLTADTMRLKTMLDRRGVPHIICATAQSMKQLSAGSNA